ncbi:Peroxisomal multifunctional enzyme A, partial [Fragariocoptes setiger]
MNNKKQLRFDGRVAIVTGAGGGLGRQYALLLASRGACVVVNDFGCSRSGDATQLDESNRRQAADAVVDEIVSTGGRAVANYDSVKNGAAIVRTATDNWGRVDIVINNAGILCDKSMTNMSEQDWDLVHQIHLRGSFQVTRAAWPYMRRQNYGRIVMTSSPAALYGNFGQANYSSAKMGLIGLSNTLSVEGAKYNIASNVIVPVASSRLTVNILPQSLAEHLKPEQVAPFVVWLCHEQCKDTGAVFEAAGGWCGRYRLYRGEGRVFEGLPTLECVRDHWDKVSSVDGAQYHESVHKHMETLLNSLGLAREHDSTEQQDTDEVVVYEFQAAPRESNDDADLLNSIPTSGLKCDLLFKIIGDRMRKEPELTEQIKAIFQFNISQDGKQVATWTTDTKGATSDAATVYRTEPKNNVKPDCTVFVDDEDFVKLMVGKLNPQRAFMMGKLNIKGNVLLLQKLNTMWVQMQNNGQAPELPLLASVVLNYKLIPGLKCDAMLVEIFQRIARAPQLIANAQYIYRINITKSGKEVACYTLNLADETPTFFRGAGQSPNADCEIEVDDDDLVRLLYGRLSLRDSLDSGRIQLKSGKREVLLALDPLLSTQQDTISKL